jgi:hypothetical protein
MAFGDVVGTVKTASASSGTSITATLDASPIAGNLIAIAHFSGANDSQARGTAVEAAAVTDAGQTDQAASYYRFVQSGDGTSWGANSGTDDQQALVVVQIEGPFTSTPLDATQTSAVSTGTPLANKTTGTTAATAQNDEVAIGVVSHRTDSGNGHGVTISAWSNSFTAVGHARDSAGTASEKGVAMCRKTLSATGAQETTATFAGVQEGGPRRAMGLIATFKKDAGVGGGTAFPHHYYQMMRR